MLPNDSLVQNCSISIANAVLHKAIDWYVALSLTGWDHAHISWDNR